MRVAVVGGSDAGIEAARRWRELAPEVEVIVLVADGPRHPLPRPGMHSRRLPMCGKRLGSTPAEDQSPSRRRSSSTVSRQTPSSFAIRGRTARVR